MKYKLKNHIVKILLNIKIKIGNKIVHKFVQTFFWNRTSPTTTIKTKQKKNQSGSRNMESNNSRFSSVIEDNLKELCYSHTRINKSCR